MHYLSILGLPSFGNIMYAIRYGIIPVYLIPCLLQCIPNQCQVYVLRFAGGASGSQDTRVIAEHKLPSFDDILLIIQLCFYLRQSQSHHLYVCQDAPEMCSQIRSEINCSSMNLLVKSNFPCMTIHATNLQHTDADSNSPLPMKFLVCGKIVSCS